MARSRILNGDEEQSHDTNALLPQQKKAPAFAGAEQTGKPNVADQ
jgi:hypothetical protein